MSEKDQQEQQEQQSTEESAFASMLNTTTGKNKKGGKKKKADVEVTETPPESEEMSSVESQDESAAANSEENPEPSSEEDPKEAATAEFSEDKLDGVSCEQGKSVIRALKQYAVDMAPTVSQNSESVVRHQRRLHNAVRVLLKVPANEFEVTLKAVLQVIRDERTKTFADRFLFRGFNELNLNQEESRFLRSMLRLLIASADTNDPRKAANVVDMGKIYDAVGNDAQQQKLQNFYER